MTPIVSAALPCLSSLWLLDKLRAASPLIVLVAASCVAFGVSGSDRLFAQETSTVSQEDEAFFETKVRPVLVERCLECHSGATAEGSLRLDTAARLMTGSEHGPVINHDDPDQSRLLLAVQRSELVPAMPPDEPLSEEEVAIFAEWIARGAPDPRTEDDRRVGGLTLEQARNWWSFQPLAASASPVTPQTQSHSAVDSPIDAYLSETSFALGLTPASLADRRTLLRRLTFDLTGLPPTESEVQQFATDARPDAVARQADRLLASHAYGQRWGRHWLDLVRYADTAGENSDHPLPHAWRYRNWVIDAWNQDTGVDDFIRWQIAGDLIARDSGQPIDESEIGGPIVATGYLAISRRFGHDSNKDMHLTYEDTIDTLGKSLLGLTLGCARCHAHKYDPVTSEDYYSLYGVFASTKYAFAGCEAIQQPSDLVPIVDESVWQTRFAHLQTQRDLVEQQLTATRGRLDRVSGAMSEAIKQSPLTAGAIERAGEANWELLDTSGAPRAISVQAGDLILFTLGNKGDYGADTTRVDMTIRSSDGAASWNLTTDLLDDFLAGNPNPQSDGSFWLLLDGRNYRLLSETVRDLQGQTGLHVWRTGELPSILVTSGKNPVPVWTTLAPRTVFMHPAADGPVAFAWIAPRECSVTMSGVVADAHGEGGNGVDFRVDHVQGSELDVIESLVAAARETRELEAELTRLSAMIPNRPVAFAVQEGTPHDEAIQIKGEPEHLAEVVPRRFIETLGHQPLGNEQASGRRELAERLAPSNSPLAARVFVNRLWAHSFGRGLVRSLNDFGTRGELPTHPALLDRLASDLVASQSFKLIQRKIVLSNAYQRASVQSFAAETTARNDSHHQDMNRRELSLTSAVSGESDVEPIETLAQYRDRDPLRTSYAYFERRRLSAEELRDSLLLTADSLDWNIGLQHPFPSQDTWSFTQHVPFSDSYPHSRRSVYLMVKRNRRDPFLALFDGADPSATTPVRQVTTVPTQALYFFNDPFFHEQAARLADQVRAGATSDEEFVDRLISRAWQRSSSEREQQVFATLRARWPGEGEAQRQGADRAIARVVLASSEFLYLD